MTYVPGDPPPSDEHSREVQLAANAIGWALQQYCHLDLHSSAALCAATNLENQGLLKLPESQEGP